MYQVTVKKFLRYDDGRSAFEEALEDVNHKRHAVNLAAKIAGYHEVEWVEIEEVKGRFKVHASRASDGEIHPTLQPPRRRVRRETHFRGERASRGSKRTLISVVILCALGYVVSQTVRSPASQDPGPTSAARSVQIGDFHVTAIALVSPSSDLMRLYGLSIRNGYKSMMVSINVSNAGQSANCLDFDPLLVVRSGPKTLALGSRALKGTNAYNLRPTESRDESYFYEIKNGTEPVRLQLLPKPNLEFSCRNGSATVAGRHLSANCLYHWKVCQSLDKARTRL